MQERVLVGLGVATDVEGLEVLFLLCEGDQTQKLLNAESAVARGGRVRLGGACQQ